MDYHGLDLNLLVAFDALLSECHVTRAALRAGVSQPAMSAALGHLRRHFNDPLFIRSAEGLVATARAREIGVSVALALAPLASLLAPAAAFSPQDRTLTFTLGLTEYAQHLLLLPLMCLLQAQAPGVTLHVQSYNDRDEAIALLDNGKVDAAIGLAPAQAEQRIHTQPLISDRFVTIVSQQTAAGLDEMDLAAFLTFPHILVSPEGHRHGLADEQLRLSGQQRKLRLTLPSMFVVPEIVAGSPMAATLLSRAARNSAASEQLRFFPPPLPMPEVTFSLLWHRRSAGSEAQRWLRSQIADAAGQIAAV